MQKILIIYTGGTIGMNLDTETMTLKPFDFKQIMDELPELKKFDIELETYSFNPVIDSSDVDFDFWKKLAHHIEENYSLYDGFVVLHGTDTMAYSASALSFMLEDLSKPVIFTGSQLPIGMLRTDGKENVISSIEIAAATEPDGHPSVPEVCIYFESQLYRGNRTIKYSAENFRAFRSPNFPVLADVGIHIKFNNSAIHRPNRWNMPLIVNDKLDDNVAVMRIFPGISKTSVKSILNTKGLRAVILETYGSGNAPAAEWFIGALQKAINQGIVVVNVTQCGVGAVNMSTYSNGKSLQEIGVIGGNDITLEAALTKLFYLLGKYDDNKTIATKMSECICGEFSKNL
ncbi:MAG: type I asparaginase [Bacteroidales bacterium]|nr:type I asparaginase [Bacteroidales bacterium]